MTPPDRTPVSESKAVGPFDRTNTQHEQSLIVSESTLVELERLIAEATPGPYIATDCLDVWIEAPGKPIIQCGDVHWLTEDLTEAEMKANAKLVLSLMNLAPSFISTIRAQREALEEANALLRRIREQVGEGIHTGLRKGVDGKGSDEAWRAIANMKADGWSEAIAFFACGVGLTGYLKRLDRAALSLTTKEPTNENLG